MGTRGYIGIRYKGKSYYFYNHWDSYPDGLGAAIVREILKMLAMDGGIEGFCTKVLDKVFFVQTEEEVPKALEMLKTSGVTYSSACLKEGDSSTGLFEVRSILGLCSSSTATPEMMYEMLDKVTLYEKACGWVKTKEDLERVTNDGGFVRWTISSPKGPLERFLRLGVAVPTLIVEGKDEEDHRDLFIEYTYLVDFDAQALRTSGMDALPFESLASEKAFVRFVELNEES